MVEIKFLVTKPYQSAVYPVRLVKEALVAP